MVAETVAQVVLHNCDALEGKELAEVMCANENWPYPGELDGWILSHNSIRDDMTSIRAGMQATLKRAQGGKAMEAWEPANLAKFFQMFYVYVHEHHDHEEDIFFPWMAKRMVLPPKMSSDHATLMVALDKCLELAKGMKATGSVEQDTAQLQAFLAAFDAMEVPMLEHLKEEEEIGLPNMRKVFTKKDIAPIEKKIVATMTTHDLTHFLNHMKSVEDKKVFMSQVALIPGFVQSLIMLPACKKYSKKWQRLLDELKAGQRVQKKKGMFRWLRA